MDAAFQDSLSQYRMKRKMEAFALEKGYMPYEPMLFEEYDQYSCMNKTAHREQLVTVMNNQQKFQLLRPDITTALMKQVLPLVNEQKATKLFYQSTIYRSHVQSVQEINQFGIEYLGKVDWQSEKEVMEMAVAYLKGQPFLLEVGNTKFLEGLLRQSQLNAQQKRILKKLIYTKNREELISFSEKNQLPKEVQEILPHIFLLRGKLAHIQKEAQKYILNSEMAEAIAELTYFAQWEDNISFDLSMQSQLPYYEGVIFKGYYKNLPKEVLSGGRYDALSKEYGKRVGAIGFSVDTDAWLSCQKGGSVWNG